MNEPHRSLARSLADERTSAGEMPVYPRRDGEYTLANNAKPINFQFRQACIADRVCASLDRHSRPRFRPALLPRSRARRLPLKVKPTCNFRRTDAARTKVRAGGHCGVRARQTERKKRPRDMRRFK